MGVVMKRMLLALTSGCLFGSGLLISGMTDTAKVQGWLDILGAWDPTLAFVMGGAIIPMAVAWRYSKNKAPLFADKFPTQAGQKVNRDLIAGSVLFGMGWAVAGLCPGPAVAALGFGGTGVSIFFASMLIGMLAAKPISKRNRYALEV
jgi:hypothetical protein